MNEALDEFMENQPTLSNVRLEDTLPSMRIDVEFCYKAAREVTGDAGTAAKIAQLFLRMTKG